MSTTKDCFKYKRFKCLTGDGNDKISPFSTVDTKSEECSRCLGLNDVERSGDKVNCKRGQPISFFEISSNCYLILSIEFEVLSAMTKGDGP